MKKNDLILVTGGAGFIGSNLVRHLNDAGYNNIVVLDDLTDGRKFKNIRNCKILDYKDWQKFFGTLALCRQHLLFFKPKQIFHLGAISSTTHKNGKELMENNYQNSFDLIVAAMEMGIPVQYASSASVYGNEQNFDVAAKDRKTNPLNCYAFSKLMLDRVIDSTNLEKVIGLRFFNVYGPNEFHKEGQCSPILSFYNQLIETGEIKVFDIESKRDFVHVDDVCKFMIFLMEKGFKSKYPIDVGTGESRSFKDVAELVMKWTGAPGKITTIPMPKHLMGAYQYHTKAEPDMQAVGYTESLWTLERGVLEYVHWLKHNQEV